MSSKDQFSAKILADSVNVCGNRLTTFELTYPRMIHCFLDDTEFLSQVTDEFPEFRTYDAIVTLGAKVAQYSENGDIEFVAPSAWVSKYVESIVVGTNKLFPLAVTHEHRMYSMKRSTGNIYSSHVDTAADWLDGPVGHRRVPKAGYLSDTHRTSDVSPEEAALIAFYVADGHVVGTRAVFHFVKRRKVDAVTSLLDALGIEYVFSDYGRDCCIKFDAPYWVSDCYTESGTKKYPDFVWSLSPVSYSAFYEASLDSDGCRANLEINTTSTDCANQLQVVSLLNGKAMNIRSYGRGRYKALYKQSYLAESYISFRKDKDSLEECTGRYRVVCFQVPSSFLVVRRAGVVFVSGNCEIMTHRLFSRNAASSRAIPIQKTLAAVSDTPFVPFHWGANQAGMQADSLLSDDKAEQCQQVWLHAMEDAVGAVEELHQLGLHKQIANRLLEPFMYITVVLSTTSFKHFELLRNHPAAEPHFQYLAQLMVKARQDSVPELLQHGQWHLPLIYDEDRAALSLDDLKKVSVARCAAVSYVRHNERKEYDKDIALHDRLTSSGHWSPTEHVATPFCDSEWIGPSLDLAVVRFMPVQSGNFLGWKQYRKEFDGEFVPDAPYTGPTR